MACNCSNGKNLPSCITDLIIGTANTQYNYYVYLRTPNGRIDKYTGTFIYGTQLLQISDIDVRIGEQYEVWITKDTAGSIENRESFTTDSTSVTCVLVTFEYCDNEFDTQTIELV